MDDDYGVGMTREAKIGLLVALAFLLVIGILLSDHVTVATRQPLANLTGVDGNIKGSVAAPGATGAGQPQLSVPPTLPQDPAVQTASDYVYQPTPPQPPQPAGQVSVELGQPVGLQATGESPLNPSAIAGGIAAWENPPLVAPQPGATQFQTLRNEYPGNEQPGPTPIDQLQQVAQDAGESLVSPDRHPPTPAAPPTVQEPATPKVAGVVEYTAQKGDSLSKIVAKSFGRYTPENRESFLKLNPQLRSNPDLIVVGRSYLVPGNAGSAQALSQATARASSKPQTPVAPAAPAKRGKTYTVQSGDTLWAIAEQQLGDPNLRHDILKLNSDQIANANAIQVGMKLKLPG